MPAFFVAVVFLGVMTYALINTVWPMSKALPVEPTTAAIASQLLGEGGYLLPLEIAGVLLLAAILGAIVLVREK
jgi:NADH-quinone oxidoreductase subunit J